MKPLSFGLFVNVPQRKYRGCYEVINVFDIVLVSPLDSGSEPITSRISPSFQTDDISVRPSGMVPMDQYLPRGASLLSGESTDFPFLPAPLTPCQII